MSKTRWTENADIALYAVLAIWAAYLLNYLVFPVDFRAYGIRPREIAGLWGILLCPFLHANLAHIVANSVALFVLLTLALTLGRGLTALALVIIVVIGGGGVWLIGDTGTNHVGASGVVYGLIGFLLTAGLVRRNLKAVLVAAAVFLIYGGALLSLLKSTPGTSWAAHFFGLLAGILAAWRTRKWGTFPI